VTEGYVQLDAKAVLKQPLEGVEEVGVVPIAEDPHRTRHERFSRSTMAFFRGSLYPARNVFALQALQTLPRKPSDRNAAYHQ
jgi:hypothetical protein